MTVDISGVVNGVEGETQQQMIMILDDDIIPTSPVCVGTPNPTTGAVVIVCTNIASGGVVVIS